MQAPSPEPVPAHWLRHNAVTRVPRRHIFLDTETVATRVGGVETQVFRLGVAAYDRQDQKGGLFRPTEWGRFRSPAELWEWITVRAAPGKRLVVWCHNLGFDLRVADGLRILPGLGWDLDMISLGESSAFCRWRLGRRTLVLCDSTSWFPAKLADLAPLMGEVKPPLPAADDSEDAWWGRCEADVRVLRLAVRRVLEWIERDDLGNWRPTGTGQGWAAYRHRHLTHPVLHHGRPEVAAVERAAAWTGRTEAWMHGDLGLGPWTEFDFRSAHATIALECDLPAVLIGRSAPYDAQRLLKPREGRVNLFDCVVTTSVPTVPTAGSEGIVWPVGSFRSWLWDVEVHQAIADGATVKVGEAFSYRSAPILRGWAEWIFSMLDAPADQFDPVLRLVVKGWSRNVIGRFGARWPSWEDWGEPFAPPVSLTMLHDLDSQTTSRVLTLTDRCYREGALTDAHDGAVHVMSYVMAVARMRLWAAMRAAGLEHVAHVDTDGLVVDTAGRDALLAARIPGLRVKSVFHRLRVLGPRQLVSDGRLHVPGVPRSAVKVDANRWTGEVWSSLAGGLSGGEGDRVTVTDRVWQPRGVDRRRRHVADGRTEPFRLVHLP